MLTKNDLKQIDEVVAKRIKSEIAPVKKDITIIRKDRRLLVSSMKNIWNEENELKDLKITLICPQSQTESC